MRDEDRVDICESYQVYESIVWLYTFYALMVM